MEKPAPPDALIEGLKRHLLAQALAVDVITTHISWVLLAGEHAYKIKKPLRLPFLDYSTRESRQQGCEEELRLNRRLAPELYLAVVPVVAGPDGPSFGGAGPVVDYAVKMKRFPAGALGSELLAQGRLSVPLLAALARRLAAFHEAAPRAPAASPLGSATTVRAEAQRAVGTLATLAGDAAVAPVRAWLARAALRLAPLWRQRQEQGWVREGHGDLHLDNVVLLGEALTAFDGIEFNAGLRWLDVMGELGFLVMDLLAHGRRDLAFAFLDASLQASGDYAGLAVLPHALVYRAVVRAMVCALHERQQGAGAAPGSAGYLRLAQGLCVPAAPRLLITHGLPGSGKSQLSQQLLEQAGAVRVRSDVERRRLHPGAARYAPAASESVYEHLAACARSSLQAGFPTLVDATFLARPRRQQMQALAAELCVPFQILDCQAPLPVLNERVAARSRRGGDASEADTTVLQALAQSQDPLDAQEQALAITVRTDQALDPAALARRWLAAPLSR